MKFVPSRKTALIAAGFSLAATAVLSGVAVAESIFKFVQPDGDFTSFKKDGDEVKFGEIAFEIELHPQHGMHKEEYLDHPVAIFKYDKKANEWNFSTKYHEEIHQKEKIHRK